MKKIFLFVVLSLILVGCEEKSSYALLFTSDYEYGNDVSYIVSYNKTGNVLDTYKIDGALYYNVNAIDDKYFISNGASNLCLDNELQLIHKTVNQENMGVIEIGDSFNYKGSIINIHNYGYKNKDEYITKVSSNNKDKIITVNGWNLNYIINNNYLYILVRNKDKIEMDIINLDEFKVIEIVSIEIIDENAEMFGLKQNSIKNNMIYFKFLNNNIEIYYFNINTYKIEKYNLGNKSPIIPYSIFEYNSKLFYISKDKELICIEDKGNLKPTGISLPNEFGLFLLTKKKDNILYVLDSGTNLYKMVIIDLDKLKIINKIDFDISKETKNLDAFSFHVLNH